jgi:hypothetical protein
MNVNVQDAATRAWNFFVALYYKAGGRPWSLADMEDGLAIWLSPTRANSPDGSTRIARMFQRRHRHRIIEQCGEPIAILSRMEQQDIRLPVSVQVAHADKLPAAAGREQRWRLEGAVTVAK